MGDLYALHEEGVPKPVNPVALVEHVLYVAEQLEEAGRHYPRRDDAVARWLRERREQARDVEYFCIDQLLNAYREKAACGLALDEQGGAGDDST